MPKIDYRKMQALGDEIIQALQSEDNEDLAGSVTAKSFLPLIAQIKSELRVMRLQLIADFSTKFTNKASPAVELKRQTESSETKLPEKGLQPEAGKSLLCQTSDEPWATKPAIRQLGKNQEDCQSEGTGKTSQSRFSKPFSLCILGLVMFAIAFVFLLKKDYSASNGSTASKGSSKVGIPKADIVSYPAATGKERNAQQAFHIGKSEMEKKNYRVAREYFRLALSLDPQNPKLTQAMRDLDVLFKPDRPAK